VAKLFPDLLLRRVHSFACKPQMCKLDHDLGTYEVSFQWTGAKNHLLLLSSVLFSV
jgi:hypothetical protein